MTANAQQLASLRRLGIRSILLGAGLAVNSSLGPLLGGVVDYPVTETMRNQTLGLDAVSLLVVAPLSVVTGILALRRHPAAPALALGPATYTAYMFVQYIVGPNYLYSPAPLVLHLGLFVLGWSTAFLAWKQLQPEVLLLPGRRADGLLAAVLLFLTAFIMLRYLPVLTGSFRQAPLSADARGDPAMFWTILLLDLGVVVPAAAAAGINLLSQRSGWARKAGYATVGWFALVGTSVAAMGLTMVLQNDPYASTGTATVFVLIAIVAVVAAVWLFAPIFARQVPEVVSPPSS